MRYWLQDGTQWGHTHGHIQQVGGKEEVVEVAEDREDEVPQAVQERLQEQATID